MLFLFPSQVQLGIFDQIFSGLVNVYHRFQGNTLFVSFLIQQNKRRLLIVEQEAAQGFANIVIQKHTAVASGVF